MQPALVPTSAPCPQLQQLRRGVPFLGSISRLHPKQEAGQCRFSSRCRPCTIRAAWKPKDSKNVDGRAKALLQRLRDTDGSRAEAVAVLDSWAAFQQDFPLLATKRALLQLRKQQSWSSIVQVSKWMLEKGQGRTFGTYTSLLEALSKLGRDVEVDALWDLVLEENLESVPRVLFAQVMKLCAERGRPLKVLEVYGSMDALGIRLDDTTLNAVLQALNQVGASALATKLAGDYGSTRVELRYSNGVQKRVKTYRKSSRHPGVEFERPSPA